MMGLGGRLDLQADDFLRGRNTATDTSTTEIIAAQGSGYRVYLTDLIISNSSSTATEVAIKSGSTTIATVPAPATGGALHTFRTPMRLGDNEALNFAAVAGVSTITVTASGFKGR